MEILIVIAVIVTLIFLFSVSSGEPNVENFTLEQMNRHITALQNWIDKHSAILNPSDSVKAELNRKRAQCDHALTVWKKKNDEATKLLSEEAMAKKINLFVIRLRELTLRLAQKRIILEDQNSIVTLEALQTLSDIHVSSLPESNIVTMAATYRRLVGEGAKHEDALSVLNSTRVLPIKWSDTSKFHSIEHYILERLAVELAAPSLSEPALKYFTHDFIQDAIIETNRVVHQIFGY